MLPSDPPPFTPLSPRPPPTAGLAPRMPGRTESPRTGRTRSRPGRTRRTSRPRPCSLGRPRSRSTHRRSAGATRSGCTGRRPTGSGRNTPDSGRGAWRALGRDHEEAQPPARTTTEPSAAAAAAARRVVRSGQGHGCCHRMAKPVPPGRHPDVEEADPAPESQPLADRARPSPPARTELPDYDQPHGPTGRRTDFRSHEAPPGVQNLAIRWRCPANKLWSGSPALRNG
jgi:hypothetical protein